MTCASGHSSLCHNDLNFCKHYNITVGCGGVAVYMEYRLSYVQGSKCRGRFIRPIPLTCKNAHPMHTNFFLIKHYWV